VVVPLSDVDGLVVAVRADRIEGVHNLWHLLLVLPVSLCVFANGDRGHFDRVAAVGVHSRQQVHRLSFRTEPKTEKNMSVKKHKLYNDSSRDLDMSFKLIPKELFMMYQAFFLFSRRSAIFHADRRNNSSRCLL
jgi:hypothetical protein